MNSPLDFECYLCCAAKGAFCVDSKGAKTNPHKVRTRAATVGEVTRGLKRRSTRRVCRSEKSSGGAVRSAQRMAEFKARQTANANAMPLRECDSKQVPPRPKGACIVCDELGHNRLTCPKRRAS